MGYPLLVRYGLAVFPGQGSLIFEEDLSGETITVPASEPPPGLELTQVVRDNPIQSVVPLYSVFSPTVTGECPSDSNRDVLLPNLHTPHVAVSVSQFPWAATRLVLQQTPHPPSPI